MHTCLGEAHLPAALNCSIVGLTTSQGKEEGAEGANTPLQCLGFGIVRSVDAGKGVLHILTDVQSDLLEQVDVLQVPLSDCATFACVSEAFAFFHVYHKGFNAALER